TLWVVITICMAVFIRQLAIVFGAIIVIAAGYNIKKRYIDKKTPEQVAAEHGYGVMDEEAGIVAVSETTVAQTAGGGGVVTEKTVIVAKS
ncbi:MAG: hypothetical protein SGILL_006445, partial [Bacillariaceae sp.]